MENATPTHIPQIATGLLLKKVILSLLALVIVGGSAAAGYFVFGENLGLTSPKNLASTEHEAVPSTHPLFDLLPGADANVLLALRLTPVMKENLREAIQSLQQRLANEGKNISEEDVRAFLHIEEIAVAAKVDFSPGGKPVAAVAIKVENGQEAVFEEKLKEATAKDTSGKIVYESKGNGVFVTRSGDAVMHGTFSENPLSKILNSHGDSPFRVAVDGRDLVSAILTNPGGTTPPEEELHNNPKRARQIEIEKNLKNIGIFGDVLKEGDASFFALSLEFEMQTPETAAQFEAEFRPVLEMYRTLLPAEFQMYFVTQYAVSDATVEANIKIGDLHELEEKIAHAVEKAQALEELPVTSRVKIKVPRKKE